MYSKFCIHCLGDMRLEVRPSYVGRWSMHVEAQANPPDAAMSRLHVLDENSVIIQSRLQVMLLKMERKRANVRAVHSGDSVYSDSCI